MYAHVHTQTCPVLCPPLLSSSVSFCYVGWLPCHELHCVNSLEPPTEEIFIYCPRICPFFFPAAVSWDFSHLSWNLTFLLHGCQKEDNTVNGSLSCQGVGWVYAGQLIKHLEARILCGRVRIPSRENGRWKSVRTANGPQKIVRSISYKLLRSLKRFICTQPVSIAKT